MRARSAIIGIAVASLLLYALLGGAGKAAIAPLTAKPVSASPADKFSAAATSNSTGTVNVVAVGPSHSLYNYWEIAGAWYGPLGLAGAGSVYSGPGITTENSGNIDVAAEGPANSLLFWWQIGSTWYGPLQIAPAGSAYSAPSVIHDVSGNVDVTAQGPNGSLYFWWAINGAWHGPLGVAGPGTVFSAPSATSNNCGSSSNCVYVSAQGIAHEAVTYVAIDGAWTAPSTSGQNQEYSSSDTLGSVFGLNGSGGWISAYQGPGNSGIAVFATKSGGSNAYCVGAGAGTFYSAPSMFGYTSLGSNEPFPTAYNIAVDGPSQSLYAFWYNFDSAHQPTACPTFYGPLQLNGAATTFSVPAMTTTRTQTENVVNVLAEGPSHTLWGYWSSNGSWYGPLQIGGPGTTFDAAG